MTKWLEKNIINRQQAIGPFQVFSIVNHNKIEQSSFKECDDQTGKLVVVGKSTGNGLDLEASGEESLLYYN